MLNFGASKPRVKGGQAPPLDSHLRQHSTYHSDLLISIVTHIFPIPWGRGWGDFVQSACLR